MIRSECTNDTAGRRVARTYCAARSARANAAGALRASWTFRLLHNRIFNYPFGKHTQDDRGGKLIKFFSNILRPSPHKQKTHKLCRGWRPRQPENECTPPYNAAFIYRNGTSRRRPLQETQKPEKNGTSKPVPYKPRSRLFITKKAAPESAAVKISNGLQRYLKIVKNVDRKDIKTLF